MPKLYHDTAIDWPNGLGFTPCSREYAETSAKRDALLPEGVNLDDLSPADYQSWHTLQARLDDMLLNGHVGKSIRY